MILQSIPSPEEFYKTYWNKRPFIVRAAIPEDVIDGLIDGDTLAALSLEDEVTSRLVKTLPDNEWTCQRGPMPAEAYEDIGNQNWSLLVQNVEQYHPNTATLLNYFDFAPRWLMDDIMVSFSATGGTVGPHTDSYHVFLTQGMGQRQWKISNEPITNQQCLDHEDLIILKDGFEGDTYTVTKGDLIYIPPHFGHQGITTEPAMTFSVGFLGPKTSELLSEYARYIEDVETNDARYIGQGLELDSTGSYISPKTQQTIAQHMKDALSAPDFTHWVGQYFSVPTHADPEDIDLENGSLSTDEMKQKLEQGASFIIPAWIKITLSPDHNGQTHVACLGQSITLDQTHTTLVTRLATNTPITAQDIKEQSVLDALSSLHNIGALIAQ